jgi:hypothetical protein
MLCLENVQIIILVERPDRDASASFEFAQISYQMLRDEYSIERPVGAYFWMISSG